VTSRRFAFISAAVAAFVLGAAAVFAACGSESSERSERRQAPTTTPSAPSTTVTTVAPLTIPVPPLPPAGPTSAPSPAITVPRGTVSTLPPASTTPPTVTAAPATSTPASTTPPTVTNAPASTTTTKPSTSTTKPGRVTRRTAAYSPPGAPKRQGDLVVPRQHADTIVVLVHGEGTRKQMRGWADFYAQNGYPSFAIEYLVEKPSTPAPVYPKPETDVKAAVQYLRGRAGQLGVDPDRIVVQGFTTGAALAAQAEVTPNDVYFDGPAHYPNVSDAPAAFVGFDGRYDGGGQKDPTKYYGGPSGSPDPQVQERYAKADSIAQAASAAGPALLYADEDDPDARQSATSFRDALQSAGKDVTLTMAPRAGGAFDQQVAQQVLEWLEERFPPS
jgi:acetyl esterase/lipase